MDGQAGTFGWDPVVVQAEFQWNRSSASLYRYLDREFTSLGFRYQSVLPCWVTSGPGPGWVNNRMRYGPIVVTLDAPIEGTGYSILNHQWQAGIEARPIGRMVDGGC